MVERRKHPLALDMGRGAGFDIGSGRFTGGDRIVNVLDNKHGYLDEVLQDGDAFISLDDGTFDCVKWGHLRKEIAASRLQETEGE